MGRECLPIPVSFQLNWRLDQFHTPSTLPALAMFRSAFLVLLSCPLAIIAMADASADTVELRGGGQITGQVIRKPDWVIVKVDDDLQLAIQPSRVIRVVTSDKLQDYRRKVIEAGNDALLLHLGMSGSLRVLPAALGGEAGLVGAAALLHTPSREHSREHSREQT